MRTAEQQAWAHQWNGTRQQSRVITTPRAGILHGAWVRQPGEKRPKHRPLKLKMYGANSCWFHKKGHLLTPCSTRRSSPPLKPGTLTTTTPVSFSLMFYMVAEIHESQSFCHAPILSTTPDTATCAPFFTQCPPTLLQNGTPLRVIYLTVSLSHNLVPVIANTENGHYGRNCPLGIAVRCLIQRKQHGAAARTWSRYWSFSPHVSTLHMRDCHCLLPRQPFQIRVHNLMERLPRPPVRDWRYALTTVSTPRLALQHRHLTAADHTPGQQAQGGKDQDQSNAPCIYNNLTIYLEYDSIKPLY